MRSNTGASRAHMLYMATLLVIGSGAVAQAANLLSNPTFEAPPSVNSTDNTVAGWTLVGDAQRATFANHTPGGARSIWFKTFLPDGGGVQQTVGITGGANYAFSGFNFFETSYPNTSAVVTNSVTWLNAAGAAVGTPATVTYDPAVNPPATGAWVPFSLTATAPAGAVSARIFGGWDGGGTVTGAQSAFLDDLVFDGPGTPPPPISNDWIPTTSGDWNVGANWLSGNVPNAIDAPANFVGSITSPHTVYSDTAVTAGKLKFDNANQYVIAGAGSLTLDVSTGNATIDVLQGSHKINLPLRLNDATVANVASGATLTIADPLILANGSTLTRNGAGTLDIISTVTTVGGASSIVTTAGTTNLRVTMGGTTSIRSTGGETRLFATQRTPAVQIDGGTVALDSAGPVKVLATDSLTIAGGASPAGKLDLGDNGAIVRYTGASPAASIRELIKSGRTGGNGIGTSVATAGRSIGYAESAQVGSPANFLGEAVGGTAVLLRYTLNGDTNLDGTVAFADLVNLAQNYNGTGKVWVQGDSNYDGAVNFADLVALAQNYNQTLTSLQSAELGASFAADFALAQSLVPEPTTIAALGLGAVLVRRKRRA